jgi:hypothetical protein
MSSVADSGLPEAWMRLLSQALGGSAWARSVVRRVAEAPTPAEAAERLAGFLGTSGLAPGEVEDWLETCWRALGVVPRARYLDLLERYDRQQAKLKAAEDTIRRLRTQVGGDAR